MQPSKTKTGSTWYVIDGSVNVNRTFNELTDGVHVEHINDFEAFTASSPIESEWQLEYEIKY